MTLAEAPSGTGWVPPGARRGSRYPTRSGASHPLHLCGEPGARAAPLPPAGVSGCLDARLDL